MAMAEEHPWNEQGFLYSITLYHNINFLTFVFFFILLS